MKLEDIEDSDNFSFMARSQLPAIVRENQEEALLFLEFFATSIRNGNTRAAYLTSVDQFSNWVRSIGLSSLKQVQPIHVGTWIEIVSQHYQPQTAKLKLAAIRRLLDWFVLHGRLSSNPAQSVRGPQLFVSRGRTPTLTSDETKRLLGSIEQDTIKGLRDRALIATMIYSFSRVSAALKLRIGDYVPRGKRWWISTNEKGGKSRQLPVHHKLEAHLDIYIQAAGIANESAGFLFRSFGGRGRTLSPNQLSRQAALLMVKNRCLNAGLPHNICNHSFRAIGITTYLDNGGSLEMAQKLAGHSDPKTTKLYDRTSDDITLSEIERIRF